MDNDKGDDNLVIALDLKHESYVDPSPPSSPAPPSPGELETSQVEIVDRIRQLQAVTARANQCQWWRRFMNNPELSHMKNKNQGDNGVVKGWVNSDGGISSGGEERVRNRKRDTSHVAKALQMDLDGEKTNYGNFFDCNICLIMAKNPILTGCGHLFCSSCFDQVPYVDSFSKECPTCQGEVTDSNITPVHGNGKNARWF